MVPLRRIMDVPELGARIHDHFFLHPAFRLFLVRRQGVVEDEQIFCKGNFRLRPCGRRNVVIPLEGEVGVRSQGEHLLREGELLSVRRQRIESVRMERSHVVLSMEWDPKAMGWSSRGPLEIQRLSAASLDRLRALALPLIEAELGVPATRATVREILRLLAAEGLPLSPEVMDLGVPAQLPVIQEIATAMGVALSALDERPMLVDLESRLARSNRQVYQYLVDFLGTYNFHAHTWRDMVLRTRVLTGIALMSSEQATTEKTARILGYSSPTAFCRAFAANGLPSPAAIRRSI